MESYGKIINEIIRCYRCGGEIMINYREKSKKKSKYFCSGYCSHGTNQKWFFDNEGVRHEI